MLGNMFGYGNILPLHQDHQNIITTFDEHHHISRKIKHSNLQLKFFGNIKKPVHTGVPIQGNGEPIRIAIVDVASREIVKCVSGEVEIVVLGEEFGFRDDQEWSPQDFSSKVLYGKNGKSLLRGDQVVFRLKDGACSIEGVCFKHMSDWFKKTKVRLGAKLVGDFDGTRIREAKTEPFFVKDRRTISKRDRSLLLTDNIWEIKGIGKKSTLANRLIENNIVTVKDFLVKYNLYQDRLKQIFEEHRHSHKFEAILEHALSCQIDEKRNADSSPVIQQTSVVVNTTAKFTRMMHKEDRNESVEEISEAEKRYIPGIKRQQAQDSSKSLCSCDESESSCSYAVKKQRITTSTIFSSHQRDRNAERNVTSVNFGIGDNSHLQKDFLGPHMAPSHYAPTFLNDKDNLHDQPLFSPFQDDILLWDANFVDDHEYCQWLRNLCRV